MSQPTNLALAQASPIWVPLRFFITAPLFALTAALLLWKGADLFSNRWNPAMLGITHLIRQYAKLRHIAGNADNRRFCDVGHQRYAL